MKETAVAMLILLGAILIILACYQVISAQENECAAKGGVYLKGKCFKKDALL
jgi:hypothetical protein